MSVWLLALLFGAAEVFWVTFRVRRSAHGFSLSEIPLVLGLATVSPAHLVVARLIGSGLGLLLSRTQWGIKLVFNLSMWALEICVATLLYSALLAGHSPLEPRGWVAAFGTVLAVDALAAVLVTAVIAVHDDPSEWARLPLALQGGIIPAVSNTAIALLALLATHANPAAGLLLLMVAGIAYVANQRYVSQNESRTRVERLYDFTRDLGGAVEVDTLVQTVLTQARDELRAETAELLLPAAAGLEARRWRLDDHGVRQVPGVDAARMWWAGALAGETVLLPSARKSQPRSDDEPADGMAVPIGLHDGYVAVLAVANSLGDVATFAFEDLRLFEAMGNHTAIALANASLVERLRRQAAEQEHVALHDALTGLPNRRFFQVRLEQALQVAVEGELVAVLLMDLNGFKDINDTLGHDIGDRLLVEVGARLRIRLRGRGVVARLGGDEFAVLLTGARSPEEVRWLAEEVVRSVGSPFCLEQLTLDVPASLGVAMAPLHGQEARTLLQRADVAMYVAKTARSGIEIYEPGDDHNSHRRLVLLGSLGQAITTGELRLAYQPKIDARTARVVGVEALVRWDHPELGPISPDEFVSLAEHAGLIRPLTLFVLEGALRECARWRALGYDLTVAVNVSTRSLLDVALPDDIARLLLHTHLDAAALTLEITESSIMSDPTRCGDVLDRIAALDVSLSIDDFGTGYSSLAYLKRLPVQEVKIDKSFVLGVMNERGDRSIVRATVHLAHELGLRVVAEGVEDEETYRFLEMQGCDVVQGFLFSRPLAATTLESWLASRTHTIDLTRVRSA